MDIIIEGIEERIIIEVIQVTRNVDHLLFFASYKNRIFCGSEEIHDDN